MKVSDARAWLVNQLSTVSDSPAADADSLLANILHQNRAWLYAYPDVELNSQQQGKLNQQLTKRRDGWPIAYLNGRQEFWSLELEVSPHVLIPRADTEVLVEQALALIPTDREWNILDAGTGSGAIAIAIANERPASTVTAVDRSPQAIELATRNAHSHKLNNVHCLVSNWYDALQGKCFDLIVSNPPYIAADDPELEEHVHRFEPHDALLAENCGLASLSEVISGAPTHLNRNGALLVEHGHRQQAAVEGLFLQHGYEQIACHHDLAGKPRVTCAIKCGEKFDSEDARKRE